MKKTDNKYYDFYLASPFFNEEQVERVNFVYTRLKELGFKVWSPSHEGEIVDPEESLTVQKSVFELDCSSIKSARCVFAILDGEDEGTIWECGYAYANSVPIIYFVETDMRALSLMIIQSGRRVISKRNDICKELLSF